MENSWDEYYKATYNKPASKLLVEALKHIQNKDMALDLGAGALKDSKFLIDQGFKKVIAIDKEKIPYEYYKELPKDIFEFVNSSFEDFIFLPKNFDIINAQYALPFLEENKLENLFKNIKQGLKEGAIFTGQFFGLNDQWKNTEPNISFLNKGKILNLLEGFKIIKLEEKEEDKRIADGTIKHWHVFNFIAKK